MRVLTLIFGLVACIYLVEANPCKLTRSNCVLSDMPDNCALEIRNQIQMEVGASFNYLLMAAHFSKDSVNRPGFAKFFFKSASEEREHAHKLMEYLLMRGYVFSGDFHFNNTYVPSKNGLDALEKALQMEKAVTNSILRIMQHCETNDKRNDYHAVDYLINEFLEEQYQGQRDLAGKISEMTRMENTQGSLAEFLFDKELLKAA